MLLTVTPWMRGSAPVAIVECPTPVFVGRKLTCAPAEPGGAPAERSERRHHIGVAVEVVAPHAIQNEDEDDARRG